MKKFRLKRWVKVVIAIIVIILLGIITYQVCTKEHTYQTPVGEYTCRGGLIELCTGSKEVKDYLGV